MKIEKVILESEYVRLEPLNKDHKVGLCEAVSDGELWNLFVTNVPHEDEIDSFMKTAISEYESGEGLTFTIIDKITNKIVGSTRFLKANLSHKRVEIGNTFIRKSYQKSRINTEAKMLMLSHAFEKLGLNRVELVTDYLNSPSRDSILRLGAKQEGILRNHMVMPDGRVRDSVWYSIIKNEWPGVKQNLYSKLIEPPVQEKIVFKKEKEKELVFDLGTI